MAQRRMFSLRIVDTDKFMDMPGSTQALYFHLGMHGDDDGFVSAPRKILRAAGCSDDDLKLLIAKGFVIPFESGVIVITDWQINNTVRNDRYQETIYQAEKSMLQTEESGKYALSSSGPVGIPNGNQMETKRIPNESKLETQPNLTQPNLTQINNTNASPSCSESEAVSAQQETKFTRFWSVYPKRVGKQAAQKAFAKAIRVTDIETILSAVEKQKKCDQWTKNNGQYIPNPATWLNQGRWEDETEVEVSGKNKRSDFATLEIGTSV